MAKIYFKIIYWVLIFIGMAGLAIFEKYTILLIGISFFVCWYGLNYELDQYIKQLKVQLDEAKNKFKNLGGYQPFGKTGAALKPPKRP